MMWAYVGAAALVVGFGSGWKVRDWKADADLHKSTTVAVEAKDAAEVKIDAASDKFETKKAEAEVREVVVVKEVIRVVQKPVYRERCLDDDGMRIVAGDVEAANARRELAPAVPADSAASGPK